MHPDRRTGPTTMKNPILVFVFAWLGGIGASDVFHRVEAYLTGEPSKPTNIWAIGFAIAFTVGLLTWLQRRQQRKDSATRQPTDSAPPGESRGRTLNDGGL
jgi:hypothetical protein